MAWQRHCSVPVADTWMSSSLLGEDCRVSVLCTDVVTYLIWALTSRCWLLPNSPEDILDRSRDSLELLRLNKCTVTNCKMWMPTEIAQTCIVLTSSSPWEVIPHPQPH